MHDARTKLAHPKSIDFTDPAIRKLLIDIEDLRQRQDPQQRLAPLEADLKTRLKTVADNIDEAEKVKQELVSKHQLYPWSPEADPLRKSDAAVVELPKQIAAVTKQLSETSAAINKIGSEGEQVIARLNKATDDVKRAESAEQLGMVELQKLRNNLDTKSGSSDKERAAWQAKRMQLETAATIAQGEMKRTQEVADAAAEAAKTFTAAALKRWTVFSQKVDAKLADEQQQIAAAADDDEKYKIRSVARAWFSQAAVKVAPFTAELERLGLQRRLRRLPRRSGVDRRNPSVQGKTRFDRRHARSKIERLGGRLERLVDLCMRSPLDHHPDGRQLACGRQLSDDHSQRRLVGHDVRLVRQQDQENRRLGQGLESRLRDGRA